MDKSWIEQPLGSQAYIDGIYQFLDYARTGMEDGKIVCPCKKCKVCRKKEFSIEEVERHILFHGFFRDYKNWIFHGPKNIIENLLGSQQLNDGQQLSNHEVNLVGQDDMEGLLREAIGRDTRYVEDFSYTEANEGGTSYDDPYYQQSNSPHIIEDDEKYRKLVDLSNRELYPGCKNFSTLSFLLRLFNLKCMFRWPNKSFSQLLELLLDAFPQLDAFPSSYHTAKKLIKDLGLGYENIHACPNDCMLYWGENSKKNRCSVCQTSRWTMDKGSVGDGVVGEEIHSKGPPAKVMKYFPLIPRLRRMYMSSKIAEDMIWHDKRRVKDGKLRHPADADAWKEFDIRYPEFSGDPRSVRISLASDGFNPYGIQNTNYSTWPVILSVNNLPPWLCMKPSSLILSLIIPGKSGPGNDIDVYMQPLLHELKLLWEGVDAYDAHIGEHFMLRASLMYTISDFPAYAMLSGWSTKGYRACPCCAESTYSYRCGSKICYGGHRRWLPNNHPFRFQSSLFDGKEEYGDPPTPKSGSDILQEQERVSFEYGKAPRRITKKRGRKGGDAFTMNDVTMDNNDKGDVLWKKRSIFFDLPYWEYNRLHHNLDVMHIEKNVCENVLVTLLNVEGKCKDDENARLFLEENNIRQHLWLQRQEDGRCLMPPAPYSMSYKEKERFLNVLAKLKVPDGYASNISRCVNMKQRKLINLKSHDHHILMQDILSVALRASGATEVVDVLSKLSSFFKSLCSSCIDLNKLDELQESIVDTLCHLEMEFLPPFFTIMVHLLVHLVDQVKLGGPVQYEWMYPIERYLARLKGYVRNKAQPEGSIAEGYILEETITFCSRYMEGAETIFNKPKRNEDNIPNKGLYLFNFGGRRVGAEKIIRLDEKSMEQAHRYVLLHFDDIMKDLKEQFLYHKREECLQKGIRVNQSLEAKWLLEDFSRWLNDQAPMIDVSSEEGELRRALARGLNVYAKRLKGYIVNGHKFLILEREIYRKAQNSGVMVDADGDSYYGRLTDIYELDYYGTCKVVLFRCDWVDITSSRGFKRDRNNNVCVNFSKLMHTGRSLKDDPFIFSSQAQQVFYVEDEIEKSWLHVVEHKIRDSFDVGVVSELVNDDIDPT